MPESSDQNLEKCLFSRSEFLPEVRDIQSNSKVFFKSKDDAHYVAQGTKEGFDGARQKKIYCPEDTEKQHGSRGSVLGLPQTLYSGYFES